MVLKIVYTVAYQPVGTSSYGYWYGIAGRQIDWSTDGCSVPSWVMASVPGASYYAKLLRPSCVRHDFGYRNYGKVHRYQMTAARKASIDNQLYANMKRQCASQPGLKGTACRKAAWVFYKAVALSPQAHRAFFG